MPAPIDAIIRLLELEPLPEEGGYCGVTYKAAERIPAEALPARYRDPRSCSTAIYYLVTTEGFSAMHRLRSHEVFHFYLGDPLEMLQLHPDGSGRVHRLGTDLLAGERPQVHVSAGVWQGTRLAPGGSYALIGTTVSPGFEWEDFELGDRDELVARYPDFQHAIAGLTR